MQFSDWGTIAIFIATILGWIVFSDTLGLGVVALSGTIAFLVFGLVRWEDINSGVNWGVVLLYAAAISLGVEMQATGAATWLAGNVLALGKILGIEGALAFDSITSLLTVLISNTMTAGAAVAVLAPILLNTAVEAQHDPLITGFVAAISSAFGYLTPAAQPAFTIIYASGYLSGRDFFKIGIRMMVVSVIILLLLSQLYWPNLS
jgi:sodium-dependent dicarboxylate transporter 2/3/5